MVGALRVNFVHVFSFSMGLCKESTACGKLELDKYTFEPRHEISNNVVSATSKGSDQPADTRSLIRAFASGLNIL